MGNLETYTVRRRAAVNRAPEVVVPPKPRRRKRAFGLALVTVIGVAAGGVLGAVLYQFDRDSREDIFAGEKVVPPAFAAAVEAIFDTSPIADKTDNVHVNSVKPTGADGPGQIELPDTGSGLTWTPGDDSEESDLPNVVVVSSHKTATGDESQETEVASLLPASDPVPDQATSDTPHKLILAGETPQPAAEPASQMLTGFVQQPVADSGPQAQTSQQSGETVRQSARGTSPRPVVESQPLPARLLKERIEAQLNSPAAAAVEDSNTSSEKADIPAAEGALAPLGSSHFVALPEPVETVAEAVALQNGWKTTASKYVNLRARPTNKGEVLVIVPAGAELLVTNDCSRWCSVIYDGRKGYVHRDFVTQSSKPEARIDVAETGTEVAALEKRVVKQDDNREVAMAQSTATFTAQRALEEGYRKAFAIQFVNMRVEPDKDAEIMKVIPEDSEFVVEPVCKHWCGVVYKGEQGYIYRAYFEYIGQEG